jgi:hypothetical protein
MRDDPTDDPAGGIGDSLRRAEAAVARLAETYIEWAQNDVVAMRAALDAARTDPDRIEDHLISLHGVAHNVKGQGGSFGFPLITRVGQSLCRLVRGRTQMSTIELAIASAHVDAIALLLDKRVSGDGGETGQILAARLEALVDGGDRRASA